MKAHDCKIARLLMMSGFIVEMDSDGNTTLEPTRLEFEEVNIYFEIDKINITATLKSGTVVDLMTKNLITHQERLKTDYGR
jgi:hypothetical protein